MAAKKAAAAPVELPLLTVDQILGASDLVEKDVDTPEWGGKVRIRSLSKNAQKAVREQAVVGGKFDEDAFDIHLFIEAVIEPKFTIEYANALREKSAVVVDRVVQEILSLSGADQGALEAAERLFRNE